MSNDWRTQCRLFLDELEVTLYRVIGDEPIDLTVAEEQTVRLLATVAGLLRQHHVNKRGQCKTCGRTRWWLRACCRPPQCTVFRTWGFAMGQPLDVVLWHSCAIFDSNTTLEKVREWIEQRHCSEFVGRPRLSETDKVVMTQVILAGVR